jgi:hypothetical protein
VCPITRTEDKVLHARVDDQRAMGRFLGNGIRPAVLELERKIARASRIAQQVPDPTAYERLKAGVEELRQMLRQRRAARRNREEIPGRARALWVQNGRPSGRDLEFWLQAEADISGPRRAIDSRDPPTVQSEAGERK